MVGGGGFRRGFGGGGFGAGLIAGSVLGAYGADYGDYGDYGGGYPYSYGSYYDDDAGGCYLVRRRVMTNYGWRIRRVQVCN
jgi:hypothetical protein